MIGPKDEELLVVVGIVTSTRLANIFGRMVSKLQDRINQEVIYLEII
ncbi:MAG: hypothetical protein LZ174_10145 [Thaumarchaeota archaeon]|jgi:hypothetical protein|nr:hypothetical protein [Candidatus Geocrenenecus arthurdayi]